ncbi:unnamed protein product [Periconia digitata]|uniref:Uncharacterized protein n=1 Tax=Periconia digitata TaxID=1303443 RepID=A0A9W4XE75_9PLEO|nr:unnamed protein product [Periconia digitata]
MHLPISDCSPPATLMFRILSRGVHSAAARVHPRHAKSRQPHISRIRYPYHWLSPIPGPIPLDTASSLSPRTTSCSGPTKARIHHVSSPCTSPDFGGGSCPIDRSFCRPPVTHSHRNRLFFHVCKLLSCF